MADAGLFGTIYNPDVLTCLANLSNDEVFTPPDVANQMLDMLPQELFSNPDTKFLDPACKSGVFLREIAKRLLKGLEPQIPDLQERIDHIFQKQLYGIAITELTSLLARRSVYCSKYPNSVYSVSQFDNAQGNIRFKRIQHTWKDGKCIYCGANSKQYERGDDLETHAYELIHTVKPEEILSMKFDVIISNPPYQLSDGGAGPSAMPLYNKFVEQARKLNPRYMTMIIPSRWFAGGKGLDDFREMMLNDDRLKTIVDFESSKDCFEGVDIAGGVCYFLWDKEYHGPCNIVNAVGDKRISSVRRLNEYQIFIRSNEAVSVVRKVLSREKVFMDSFVSSQKPFGFRTYARGEEQPFDGAVKLLSSKGFGYVHRYEVTKNDDMIDQWKIIIGRLVPSNGELDVKPGEGYRVMTDTRILEPNEICSESYIVIGSFDTELEAQHFNHYIKGKFARFLLKQAISSVNINRETFKFVPALDFKQEWTDEKLYSYYGLTQDEIDCIEQTIRMHDSKEGIDG